MGTPHARPDLDYKADVQAMGHIINAFPMQIVRYRLASVSKARLKWLSSLGIVEDGRSLRLKVVKRTLAHFSKIPNLKYYFWHSWEFHSTTPPHFEGQTKKK